jgi:hypothetical protein
MWIRKSRIPETAKLMEEWMAASTASALSPSGSTKSNLAASPRREERVNGEGQKEWRDGIAVGDGDTE